jgi:pimeloyl-ACP methyl ester carboxylesterase
MLTWQSLVVPCFTLGLQSAACTLPNASAPRGNEHDNGNVVALKAKALIKLACEDSVESVYENPGDLGALDKEGRGDIVRCAQGGNISREALSDALSKAGFSNVEVKSDLRLFRISYRTQRAVRGPDVASALVVIPNGSESQSKHPEDDGLALNAHALRADRTGSILVGEEQRGPLVVYGHGTGPYRQDCGFSRSDPLTATFSGAPDLELRTVLALAAQGWPVIMPDYAGFVQGSPATGYIFAEDEAYSTLDATRAIKKLLDQSPGQVVLVGHSQGGHAVLSAQSYAREYGLAGELAGVVAFAPFWAPARAFGLIIWPESGYRTDDPIGSYALNTAVEYFYTHAELIDGPGRGRDLLSFNLDDLLGPRGSECNFFPDLTPFGVTGQDLFKAEFAAVGVCAATGECSDPLAQTWAERFARDRPSLDPQGAPVLIWQGAQDEVVPLTIAGCAIDKVRQDFSASEGSATFKLCADPSAEHELVESNNAAHVIQWINARTHGAPEPTLACGEQAVLEGLDCFLGNNDQ